jgi:glucose uptake protein GlcU
VGWDIDVDLTALQPVLLIELTVVLWGSVPIASLHKGIPQQQREAMTVQALVCKRSFLKVQYE